jgi:hypothetical protein
MRKRLVDGPEATQRRPIAGTLADIGFTSLQ